MRYKLVQSVALVTSFWWFCLTLYGLFDGSWNGTEELSSYVLEAGSSISLAVFIAIGIVVSAYIINEYLLSLLQKSRFARDFLQREAKVEGAGGHFWHDEALTQTPQRPRNGCYPTPSDPATLECGPA